MSLAPKDCAVIILASGLSERFGSENKLLADLGGKPVMKYVCDTVSALGFGYVCVVVNLQDHALVQTLKPYGFTIITNPSPEDGQGGSLALGVTHVLQTGYNKTCVLLADMPFVEASHILGLLEKSEPDHVAYSRMGDVMMPPVIFNGTALKTLANLSGDRGGKDQVRGKLEHTFPLSQISARDIDTLKDLEHMRTLLRKSQR